MSPVFEKGSYSSKHKTVNNRSPGKPLFIVSPKEEGTYPVILFLHGTILSNKSYSKLFDHLASHGYIVVAPQLYNLMPPKGNQEVEDAAKVLNWLNTGLQLELPNNVKADLNYVALMGHSRGGLIAFALAQGYVKTGLKLSALVGIDPVAGMPEVESELIPPILSYESFNFSIPVIVIGTGLGGQTKCMQPCAPEIKNFRQFVIRCPSSDHAHFVAKDYGHMDVLDDHPWGPIFWVLFSWVISKLFCTNGKIPRDHMRRCVAGIAVALFKARFKGDDEDFRTILQDPTVAPIRLDQV